jgi:phytol kinase
MGNIGNIVAGILMAGTPLLIFEAISRKYKVSPELTRKSIHVLSAVVIAYMTLFLSLNEIAFISVLFFVLLALSRRRRIWQSIYAVKRKGYGEVLFTIGVILSALIAQDERIFACAVLVMGFSDTLAAVVGQHYKDAHKLLNSKTIEGTAVFFLTTVFLLGAFGVSGAFAALAIAGIVTAAELISKSGWDNIVVPLLTVLLLNFL